MKLLTLYRYVFAPRLLLGAFLLTLPFPMWATLGDNAASVLTDQARMKGTLNSVDKQTYVTHEITTPAGTKIREFVSPGGAVFGVAWSGQVMPNLQQLLGPYYQQVQQAREAAQQQAAQDGSAPAPHARRAPIAVETPGLVLYQNGHQHNWHGVAYIPQLIPQGVSASDIR